MEEHVLDTLIEHQVSSKTSRPKLAQPRMYKVILLNDDYTPMDFVVNVVIKFFNKSEAEATRIMLRIHEHGKAICGIYTKDVAESKVAQINNYTRVCEYPLLCCTEVK